MTFISVVRGQSGPGQSGHSPNAGAGPVGDYDYVFDLDGDGVVDIEEFLAVCREDADIQRSLVSVHDITI